MKHFPILMSFIGFLLAISPAASHVAAMLNISPYLLSAAILALTLLLAPHCKVKVPGVMISGVEKENWVDYIITRFWKDNYFLKFFYNESKKVLAGKVVHIPQKGSKPTTRKNRTEFPAVAVRYAASDVTYALDEYSVDPTHVHELDKIELSFDALDEAYGEQIGSVSEAIADDMLIKIATGLPTTSYIRSTGEAVPVGLDGATGNRKAVIHKNLKSAGAMMNKQGVPANDRYVLFDADMYEQFTDSLSDNQARDFSRYYNAETGVVGKLHGFNIMTRQSVVSLSNADVVRALDAANLAADNAASICWQKDCVSFALGECNVFDDTDNPLYFGDIISSAQRAGGRRRRADNKGVVLIVQAASA